MTPEKDPVVFAAALRVVEGAEAVGDDPFDAYGSGTTLLVVS